MMKLNMQQFFTLTETSQTLTIEMVMLNVLLGKDLVTHSQVIALVKAMLQILQQHTIKLKKVQKLRAHLLSLTIKQLLLTETMLRTQVRQATHISMEHIISMIRHCSMQTREIMKTLVIMKNFLLNTQKKNLRITQLTFHLLMVFHIHTLQTMLWTGQCLVERQLLQKANHIMKQQITTRMFLVVMWLMNMMQMIGLLTENLKLVLNFIETLT